MANLNKKIDQQISSIPKYGINPEIFESRALAQERAFSKDRGVKLQEDALAQEVANRQQEVQDVTDSVTSLLSGLTSINRESVGARSGLANVEADIQWQNVGDLYDINKAVIDEKDKAWYQNFYAPWEAKLRRLQERKMQRSQFWGALAPGIMAGVGAAAGFYFGGPSGAQKGAQAGLTTGEGMRSTYDYA